MTGRIYEGICTYSCTALLHLDVRGGSIDGANFAQEGAEEAGALSVKGLGGQGVELFGCSKALVSLCNHHLPFFEHVHELDTG